MKEKKKATYSVALDSRYLIMSDSNMDATERPKNCAVHIKSKSGLMVNDGIFTHGLVDYGYSGSIRVALFNFAHGYKIFEVGDKIAQIEVVSILTPEIEQVDKIKGGERAGRGFGSTGR